MRPCEKAGSTLLFVDRDSCCTREREREWERGLDTVMMICFVRLVTVILMVDDIESLATSTTRISFKIKKSKQGNKYALLSTFPGVEAAKLDSLIQTHLLTGH